MIRSIARFSTAKITKMSSPTNDAISEGPVTAGIRKKLQGFFNVGSQFKMQGFNLFF
jgi:hypothetical protein